MTLSDRFVPLARTTVTDPRAAAREVIAWQLPRDVLWTALALVSALNAIIIVVVLLLSPGDMVMPGFFRQPLALFVLLAGTCVVFVHTIYWSGLALGGRGALDDVLALIVWLLTLRAVVQVGVVVMALISPALSLLFSMVASVWGFWILVNFIVTALNLDSVWRAFAIIVVGAIGLILGIGILLSVIGVGAQGVVNNV